VLITCIRKRTVFLISGAGKIGCPYAGEGNNPLTLKSKNIESK
jgi:hypothetical protein